MDECVIRIGFTNNGFEVEALDPKIATENAKPKTSWKDPWVCYSFTTKDQVLEFVEDAMDIVKPIRTQQSTTFEAAFKEATSGVENDKDTNPKE